MRAEGRVCVTRAGFNNHLGWKDGHRESSSKGRAFIHSKQKLGLSGVFYMVMKVAAEEDGDRAGQADLHIGKVDVAAADDRRQLAALHSRPAEWDKLETAAKLMRLPF